MGLFKKNKRFAFTEPENTTCFTCTHVLDQKQPVLYVTHDEEDGGWQFLCGQEGHEAADARIASLKNIVALDETLNGLYEMPLGIGAIREAIGEKWDIFRLRPA